MKNQLFFYLSFLIIGNSLTQECATFNYKGTLSGSDFVNFQWNPTLKVCEEDKTIEIGSETFYYVRGTQNSYGDFFYPIQEVRGFGWPEIGYVKIASNFELVELEFMNSVVRYSLISPKEMAQIERTQQIEREKREREKIEEEGRMLTSDKIQYSKIELLLNENKISEARELMLKLNFPKKYNGYDNVERKYDGFLENEDIRLYKTINSLIEQDKFEDAKIKLKQLNFPEKFPNTRLLQTKQDSSYILKIQEYLSNNQPDEAAKTFSLLNFPTEELKENLLEKLKESAANVIETISKDEFKKFLFDNKTNLYDLSVGKHVLKADENGNVFIDNSGKNYGKLGAKHVKRYGEFEVPIRSQYEFEVSSTIEDIGGVNQYVTGTKNYIYQKANNKYYRSKKPSKKYTTIATTYDSKISENRLCIMQPRLEYFKIEDYKYLEKNVEPRLVKEFKVSHDFISAASKPVQITGISILALWGGLRTFEFLKIP
jgi:hypothetical protein